MAVQKVTDELPLSVTGSAKTFTMPVAFMPTDLSFFVNSKNGSTTSDFDMFSEVDSGGYVALKYKARDDTGGRKQDTSTTKCVSVWEYVSGAWTEVISCTFHSFTATGFKLNVNSINSNYKVYYTARS